MPSPADRRPIHDRRGTGRHRREADDLVTTQRLEERLEAAAHEATQDRALDGHVADSRRPLDLPGRRCAHEADLDAVDPRAPRPCSSAWEAPRSRDIDGIRDRVASRPRRWPGGRRLPLQCPGPAGRGRRRGRLPVASPRRRYSFAATQAAIRARESNPSLFRMARTWLSTVCSEMNRRAPISLLVSPSAISRATSSSRFESSPASARSGAVDEGLAGSAEREAHGGVPVQATPDEEGGVEPGSPERRDRGRLGLLHERRQERHDARAGAGADGGPCPEELRREPRLPGSRPPGRPMRRAGGTATPGRRSGARSAAPPRTAASPRRACPRSTRRCPGS